MHVTGSSVPIPDRIIYVHGDRIRTEFSESARVSIRQSDFNRIVLLDPQAKTYRIEPIEPKMDPAEDDFALNTGPLVSHETEEGD